jgi:RNA polymerase sigma factor (sigma-70 family)
MMPPKDFGAGVNESEIVRRCALHPPDEDAWRVLFVQLRYPLQGVIRHVLRGQPPEVVAELVQETFVKLYAALNMFDPERGDLVAYACHIAANQARDYARSRSGKLQRMQQVFNELDRSLPKLDPAVDLQALMSDVRFELEKIVDPLDREIFLKLYDGAEPGELAAEYALSVSTIYRARRECIRQVTEAIERLAPAYKK